MKLNPRAVLSVAILCAVPVLQGCRYEYRSPGHGHGGWHRGPGHGHPGRGRPEHGRPGRGRGKRHFTTAADSTALLAHDYGISSESAQKFIDLASGDDVNAAAAAMGLSSAEVAPLARLEMPSDATIDKAAGALGEDSHAVRKVVQDFISDIAAETSAWN